MPTQALLSEEEYLRSSFPGVDPEFCDGEILERSVPTYDHGKTVAKFLRKFWEHQRTSVLFPSVETRTRVRPGRYIIPDVSVYWPNEPAERVPEFPPLIAIEVLSPEDRMSAIIEKLRTYRRIGARHVWLADPEASAFYTFDEALSEVSEFQVPELGLIVTKSEVF